MREITARALAGAVGGILVHEGDAPSVEHISLDSRKMTGNDLFVPIIGFFVYLHIRQGCTIIEFAF